jgi:hypothetical protein
LTTSSQRTAQHLSASSRVFALLRRTSLPNDALHVAAKHLAAELTVATGMTEPEGEITSSERHPRRTLSPASRVFALSRRTSLPNDAPHVAAKHPAAALTVAIGVTKPEGEITSTEFHRSRTSSPSSRVFALPRRTSLPDDALHVAAKHPAAEHTPTLM